MDSISTNNHAGVSWGAILAGAACAAALSLILLILGFGLGLSAISPWSDSGATAAAIGVSGIIWIAFTQIFASGLGGYLAGRLRVKWIDVHNDEVYFRDTAHGLITWAVATLFAAALLGSTVSAILSGGAEIAGGAASAGESLSETATEGSTQQSNYFVDSLLRSAPGAGVDQRADEHVRSELSAIIFRDLPEGDISQEDSRYVAQIVANHTGLSQQQAQDRVMTIVDQARQSATEEQQEALDAVETARESAAYSALWMFIALLAGAFFASFMATIGGRQRDSLYQ